MARSIGLRPPAAGWCCASAIRSPAHSNSPASPEATGLEVDKLNRAYVKAYFDNYLDQYKDTVGALMGKRGLQYVITDSWEAGTLNWTDDMIAEFAKRRGYDMHPWLPVLAGRVVESAEASDRFLWDFRKTIGELTAENHYDQLTTMLQERGMGRYSESHESGRAFIADGMEVKRSAAVPMSAMWTARARPTATSGYNADIRESASVAHIYGQNLVAAESLTAGSGAWTCSPETLKPTADAELANGPEPLRDPHLGPPAVDRQDPRPRPRTLRPVVHPPRNLGGTWPSPGPPTWPAAPTCSSRASSWPTSSIIYGEDSNITALFGHQVCPTSRAGYNFDYVNADALLNRSRVDQREDLTTHRHELPRAGARSQQPAHVAAGAAQDPRPGERRRRGGRAQTRSTAPAWATTRRSSRPSPTSSGAGSGERSAGKGKVYGSQTVGRGALPLAAGGAGLRVHQAASRTPTSCSSTASWPMARSTGWTTAANRAETWKPPSASPARPPNCGMPRPARSSRLPTASPAGAPPCRCAWSPNDAVFVVFRKAAAAPSRTVPAPVETALATVEGAWDVAFQPDRGAPAKITLAQLELVEREPRSRREVFLRHRHLHQDHPGAGRLVQDGRAAVARPGRREEPRGGIGQRQAARHSLEDARSAWT